MVEESAAGYNRKLATPATLTSRLVRLVKKRHMGWRPTVEEFRNELFPITHGGGEGDASWTWKPSYTLGVNQYLSSYKTRDKHKSSNKITSVRRRNAK